MFAFAAPKPRISFTCRPEDKGVIAEPIPAKGAMPDWFKRIPPVDVGVQSPSNNGLTIKRCLPFLDAMTHGWIIPLAASVRLEVSKDGAEVNAGWDFDREMVSFHPDFQVSGHPFGPGPACKFHNFWTIQTPPGWSVLITPPLNRPHPTFEILSGIVDTDTYRSPIHFPFFLNVGDGLHEIEKGAPIAQIIPFRRTQIAADIRAETPEEAAERVRILRNTRAGGAWYRQQARAPR
ncbi:MAG: DUF6065 family protein [Hyphomonadaceae bacterium]|nr:DUF6065 family protein [Hyphomonadaceae bacterium]